MPKVQNLLPFMLTWWKFLSHCCLILVWAPKLDFLHSLSFIHYPSLSNGNLQWGGGIWRENGAIFVAYLQCYITFGYSQASPFPPPKPSVHATCSRVFVGNSQGWQCQDILNAGSWSIVLLKTTGSADSQCLAAVAVKNTQDSCVAC